MRTRAVFSGRFSSSASAICKPAATISTPHFSPDPLPVKSDILSDRNLLLAVLFLGLAMAPLGAQDIASFEKRTSVKTLGNGLTVLVCERPEAPVFSFFTHVDVGSVQEVPGITGLAHMFEHMAFKGTDKIGTKDSQKEKVALEKVEQAYRSYDAERRRPLGDAARVKELEKAWKDAIAEADAFVVRDEFGEIIERE